MYFHDFFSDSRIGLKRQEWTSYLAGRAGGLGGGSGALGFLISPEFRKEVFSIPSMSFES